MRIVRSTDPSKGDRFLYETDYNKFIRCHQQKPVSIICPHVGSGCIGEDDNVLVVVYCFLSLLLIVIGLVMHQNFWLLSHPSVLSTLKIHPPSLNRINILKASILIRLPTVIDEIAIFISLQPTHLPTSYYLSLQS